MRIFERRSRRAFKEDAIKVCEEHVVPCAELHEEVASTFVAKTCDGYGSSTWARGIGGRLQRIGEIFSPQSKKKALKCADANIDIIETFSLSSEEDYQEEGDRYTSVFQSPYGKPRYATMMCSDLADPANLPNPLNRQPRDMKARLDLPCGKYSKRSILKKVKQLVEQDADSLLGGGLDIYQELVNKDSGIQDFCAGDNLRVDSNASKRTFQYNLPGKVRLKKQLSGGSNNMNIKVIDTGKQVDTSPMASVNSCSQSGLNVGISTNSDNSTRVSNKVSGEATTSVVGPAPVLSSWMQACANLPLPDPTHDDNESSTSTLASTKAPEKARVKVFHEDEEQALSFLQSCPVLRNTVSDLDDDITSASTKVSEASTKLSPNSTKASEASSRCSRTSTNASRTSTNASRTSTKASKVSVDISKASTKFSKGSSKFKKVVMKTSKLKTSKLKMKVLKKATWHLPNTMSNVTDDKSSASTKISTVSSKSSQGSTDVSCTSTMASRSSRTVNANEDCGQLLPNVSLPWIKSCAGLPNVESDLDDEKSSASTKASTAIDNPICRKAAPLFTSMQSCAAPVVDEATAVAVKSIHKYSQLSCPLLDSKPQGQFSRIHAHGKVSADYMYSFEESSDMFDEDDITFHTYDTLSTKSMNMALTSSDSSDEDTCTDHSTDTNSDSSGTEQQMSTCTGSQDFEKTESNSNARTLLTYFKVPASNLQGIVKESYRRMPSLLTTSQLDQEKGIIVPEPRKRLGMPHASLIEFGNAWNASKEDSAASTRDVEEI